MRDRLKWFGTGAALGLIVACLLGWWMFRPKPAGAEVNAPAVRQSDNSEVAKKVVVTTAPPRPHVLPKGSHVLRAEEITVTPSYGHGDEAIHVDATLVETPDGQTHFVTSSPDGTTTATDTVVQLPTRIERPEHSVIVGYNGSGYMLGYDQKIIGPVSAGGIVTYEPHALEKSRAFAYLRVSW